MKASTITLKENIAFSLSSISYPAEIAAEVAAGIVLMDLRENGQNESGVFLVKRQSHSPFISCGRIQIRRIPIYPKKYCRLIFYRESNNQVF